MLRGAFIALVGLAFQDSRVRSFDGDVKFWIGAKHFCNQGVAQRRIRCAQIKLFKKRKFLCTKCACDEAQQQTGANQRKMF